MGLEGEAQRLGLAMAPLGQDVIVGRAEGGLGVPDQDKLGQAYSAAFWLV